MKLLIDMNLAPRWVDVLAAAGIDSVHWTTVGAPTAPDAVLFEYARAHRLVVFTHDLDFGILLSKTNASGPSVLQVRSQNVSPEAIASSVTAAASQHREALDHGAIVTIDPKRARVRILPIR